MTYYSKQYPSHAFEDSLTLVIAEAYNSNNFWHYHEYESLLLQRSGTVKKYFWSMDKQTLIGVRRSISLEVNDYKQASYVMRLKAEYEKYLEVMMTFHDYLPFKKEELYEAVDKAKKILAPENLSKIADESLLKVLALPAYDVLFYFDGGHEYLLRDLFLNVTKDKIAYEVYMKKGKEEVLRKLDSLFNLIPDLKTNQGGEAMYEIYSLSPAFKDMTFEKAEKLLEKIKQVYTVSELVLTEGGERENSSAYFTLLHVFKAG